MLSGLPVGAHHSWNTVFSEDKPLVLKGTVAKVELVNPHGWIWLDVKSPDGTVTKWGIEGGPPNGLIRNGITKETLKVGEELIVRGYGSRDGSNLVAGVQIRASRRERVLSGQRRRGSDGKGPWQPEMRRARVAALAPLRWPAASLSCFPVRERVRPTRRPGPTAVNPI